MNIEVPVWYSNGSMMIKRDALDPSHPESTYNYIRNVLGKTPEDYGYYSSELTDEQKDLIETIPDEALVAELNRRERALASQEMYG